MKRNLFSTCLALSLSAGLSWSPIKAAADDIDIFTGTSGGTSTNPRILIVLDNTSNWARQSQQWPGGLQQGQAEARAIRNLVATLDDKTNIGLMEFVTGGTANDDGGFIRSAVRPMDAAAKASFSTQLDTIYNDINGATEKRNSNTAYGNLMYDVYNYFAGGNSYSPGAVLASKADNAGYTSPYATFAAPISADSTCGKTFVIFIGNADSNGPTKDSAANTAKLNELNGNKNADGSIIPVKQLGLPNFTTQNTTTRTNVGVTAACYANATDAKAELLSFKTQCSTFTEDCVIGDPTANLSPIACPSGTQSYTVVQSVFHPATTAPGVPVQGTVTSSTGTTTGYYGSASDVNPNTDHGSLTCPATTTTTSGNNTATTSYSCSYTVGGPVGTAVQSTSSAASSACYSGVGTGTGYWNPATTSDFGGLTCPTNSSCTYSGERQSNNKGCPGNTDYKITITQTATVKRQYNVTQTVTPTTVNSTTTPPYTSTAVLGPTAQCYASGPTSTSDYASSCTGTNVSCTYNNAPTSNTLASCPPGTSAYKVDGVNIELVDVPTTTSTTDTATYNADEWARMMHDKGIPVANSSVRPSVTTYTIDVYNKQPNAVQTSLMMSMAKAGGGKYFAAKNEQAILDALKQIIVEIQAVNTSFASTSLPVNATNRAQNENQVFIGMFRPDPSALPRWFGNLKRYQLVAAGSGVDLGDANGKLAINSLTGFVTPCATSFWTTDSGTYWSGLGVNPDPAGGCTTSAFNKYSDAPDGPLVEKGGAAEVLRAGNVGGAAASYALSRTMYTLSGTALVDFTAANSGLDASLVAFIRGEDVNNDRAGAGTTRPSIHGDVIHSRPLPVNYGKDKGGVRVFYGANDGALHSVKADSGVEAWSFVAPEFFGRLQRLKDNSPMISYPTLASSVSAQAKDYFFDGSVGLYQNADNSKVWIYAGMRRGGRRIYALDVTNPDAPVYKWRSGCADLANDNDCAANMSGIGQTWSTPSVALVKGFSSSTPVVAFGGGYDACEDANLSAPNCGNKGHFIYILNGLTGALLHEPFETEGAVAADVAMVDVNNDGMPDYLYAADTRGNIYRIDFVDNTALHGSLAKEGWTMRKVAYTTGGARKFLFAPALLYSAGKVYLAIGSGDREHPLKEQYPYTTPVTNRFYVYKDDLSITGDDAPAINLDSQLQDYSSKDSCDTPLVLPSSNLKGWFMDLNQYGRGEQVVTSALIAGGMVTFSTNRPIPPNTATCSTALGEARGYWVNLLNGSGAINVGGSCGGQRSSPFVGGGLPPSPVMATSVPVGDKAVSVIIGAVQKGGTDEGAAGTSGASSAIGPQLHRPAIKSKRKRSYTYISGS
ncbi:PilC/PilY family type IV pilus protein [Massilia agilis]|uniref:PilC/PilY family type IV pilus protein n=1 Tax=Massilia agilis TaxID=1811226 RepID=A0ABT2D5L4_9BURK|nr:PilC/PilY family type IV pilus protein [Massilia agilis]MCS0806581.1 PilC/PilY family type IV pilus protein [Massilia agilis]